MAKVKLGNVKGSKGDKGDRGSLWRVSDKMTGQSTSGTAFPGAGFEDSVVNDMCLNPATFDLYRCQTAGNAAAAKWVWECNIKGAPGPKGDKGDPTTVDAVLSESSANPIQNKAVATKFKDVQDSLAKRQDASLSDGAIKLIKVGSVVTVNVAGSVNVGNDPWSVAQLGTLPSEFKPIGAVSIGITVQVTNAPAIMKISTSGAVSINALGGAAPGNNWVFGNGSYFTV